MTFTELGLHWRDFQQPISTSASTPPRPRVSGKDAHPIGGIMYKERGNVTRARKGVGQQQMDTKRSGGHVRAHSLAVRSGLHKRKRSEHNNQNTHLRSGKNVTSEVPSHNRREVAHQVWFSSPFMKNGNGGERTHALEGLCPSKHTNNVVKGKHNNELIVLRECHNECESHYAQCF